MEDDSGSKEEFSNPCCLKWKEKYAKLRERHTKLEEGRSALKQCIGILEQQLAKIQKENLGFKKAFQEEKTRAENEKDYKDKECALRISLEKEISTLKSEILSLNERGGQVSEDVSQELESLRCRVSERDTEINQLKDLLEKERTRADDETSKAQKEKKKAEESSKKVQGERSKINDFKKVADIERKKAEELKLQVEKLKSDAEEAKSNLALETGKLKEAKNMLCAERKRADAERKQSELQEAKVEEQRKVAESNLNLFTTEKNRANLMSEQLDKTTQRLKELEKEMMEISSEKIKQASAGNELMSEITNEALQKEIGEKEARKKLEKVKQKLKKEKMRAENEKKKAEKQRLLAEKHEKALMEGKIHADQLARELQHYKQRVEDMGKEIQKLRLPTALLESFSHPSSGSLLVETTEMKILKKQLKLEKIRLKHAKQIAKMEISRNHLLRHETLLLKQELLKFSQRLDTLDSCLLRSYGGIDEPQKLQSLQLQREHIGAEACERNLHANGLTKTSATSSGTAVSALQEVEPTVSGLSGGTIKGNDVKLASRTLNIDGSCIAQTASMTRKRLREAHEFGKFSSPQGVLYNQTDIIPYENKLVVAHGGNTFMIDQSKNHKKIKLCSRNTPALVDVNDSDELKAKLDNLVLQHNVRISAPSAVDNLTTPTQAVSNDVSEEDHLQSKNLPGDFDEILCGDILKLLDLDNDGYEERYRKAIQRPLSPTLPQIEFKNSANVPGEFSRWGFKENSDDGVSNLKEDLAPYYSFDVMSLEIDANNRDSSLPVKNLSNSTPDNLCENDNNDQNDVSRISPLEICIAGTDSKISGEQNRIIHTENEETPASGVFLKYCVVFSENTENCSISKVYLATSDCLTELLGSASTFLQNVLPSILKADDLTAKERVSVLFSLLLHYISDLAKADSGEKFDSELVQLLKSFPQKIWSVLFDASSRRFLMQLDVQELFFLVEDFLVNGKIVIFKEKTSAGCPSTDESLDFSVQEASIPLLLAGGVVLASVCSATGHVGFLCEVSVNLLRIQLFNSWVIKLLHVFAYICGSSYFELEDHSLEISVLKCLVVYYPNHSTTCIPSIFIDSSQYSSSCASCPFVNGVASVEDIAVLLLDKLKVYASSGTSNMLNDVHLSNADSSMFGLDEYMGHFVGILSLLELVACLTSWEWTRSNIVARLVQIVESSLTEHLSASVITLLGQLGRHGIDDSKGCMDKGVEELKEWLCNCLRRSYTSKFGLHYQFAGATALVGLIGTSFEEIVRSESDSLIMAMSESEGSKMIIREWFSSLNGEQMSSFRVLQDSSRKCKVDCLKSSRR